MGLILLKCRLAFFTNHYSSCAMNMWPVDIVKWLHSNRKNTVRPTPQSPSYIKRSSSCDDKPVRTIEWAHLMWNVAAVNASARLPQQHYQTEVTTIGAKKRVNTNAVFVFFSRSVAERWQQEVGCHCWKDKIHPLKSNFVAVVWRVLLLGVYPCSHLMKGGNTPRGGHESKARSLEITLPCLKNTTYRISVLCSVPEALILFSSLTIALTTAWMSSLLTSNAQHVPS